VQVGGRILKVVRRYYKVIFKIIINIILPFKIIRNIILPIIDIKMLFCACNHMRIGCHEIFATMCHPIF